MSSATPKRSRSSKADDESLKKSKADVIEETKKTESSSSSSSAAAKTPLVIDGVDVHSLKYVAGFGGHVETEALPGALPQGQNTPQKCAYGLYAEQLSGSSFTTARALNQRSWLYKIRPSCVHKPYAPISEYAAKEGKKAEELVSKLVISDFANCVIDPNQLRWKPFPVPAATESVDFLQGLATVCGAGSPDLKSGIAIHVYACNKSMGDKVFCNADGDFLIVPQQGDLLIRTELGMMHVAPSEICVIQRGIQFSVAVNGTSRGYICEIYTGHLRLPELGPIGANGLAAPRDFLSPVAAYENREGRFPCVKKFCGQFFYTIKDRSPFDVVAYHGTLAPFKYDLKRFCPVGAVRFDHMDPSIFTVLTCPTTEAGVAALDFVFFPPRYAVQEKTFRPPYYHRNCMSEFMGNIAGQYEAKPDGFAPGGGSLHSAMVGHGPDADCYIKQSTMELKPQRLSDNDFSFMFESTYIFRLTPWAVKQQMLDHEYWECWQPLPIEFNPEKP